MPDTEHAPTRTPAFVICDIEVTDPDAYEAYKRMAAATVAAHGGRYVVRGGPCEVLEGGWEPHRVVVLEFPDADAARTWYQSPEYQRAKDVRDRAARSALVLVEATSTASTS
jgi:uncharacterized protein (DUF1330 family)